MEAVVVTECDQKAGEHEKDTYANMKLAQKTLDNMGKAAIKDVGKVGDEHQVCCHCAYPC